MRGFPTLTPLTPPTGSASGLVARLRQAPSTACGPGHRGGSAQWGPPPHFPMSKPSLPEVRPVAQLTSSFRSRGGAGPRPCPAEVEALLCPCSSPHLPAEVLSRGEPPGGQRPPHQPPQSSPLAGGQAPGCPLGSSSRGSLRTMCRNRGHSYGQSPPPSALGPLRHCACPPST